MGDIICFSMPLLSSSGDSGYWHSSAPEVLSVDVTTGIARAKNPGHVTVKHSIAPRERDEIYIDVQPIQKVRFLLKKKLY